MVHVYVCSSCITLPLLRCGDDMYSSYLGAQKRSNEKNNNRLNLSIIDDRYIICFAVRGIVFGEYCILS
jgi:hypothetical protein